MDNSIRNKIKFSVVTEDLNIQAYTLEAHDRAPEQLLEFRSGNLYVLQDAQNASLNELLVGERSGDELRLSFLSQDAAPTSLTLTDFFASNGALHALQQNGELKRVVASEDFPRQGPVTFTEQVPSAAEQHQAEAVQVPLQHVMFVAVESDAPPAVEPAHAAAPPEAAPLQLAAFGLAPLAIDPPSITFALDSIGTRTGVMSSGDVTDDRYAQLNGTGPANTYLDILDNGQYIGEVRVGNDGKWQFEPDEPFGEAGHVLTARVRGGTETSNSFVLVVDTIAPTRVVIDSITDDRAGNQIISNNGYTGDNTPVIEGRADAFSIVVIYNGRDAIGTSLADASGHWKFSSPFVMPDGAYSISAQAVDYSGNIGLSSAAYKITVDTIPPAVPTILSADDDVGSLQGTLLSGAKTDDHRPTLHGKAEAGTTVFVYNQDGLLGTAQASGTGDWSFTPPSNLSDGEHQFTAIARDLAGNNSTRSPEFILDFRPDSTQTPTIDIVIDDVGAVIGTLANGDHTDDEQPTLRGRARAGDTVQIYDNKVLIGIALTNMEGVWTFTPSEKLAEGAHRFEVQAVNGKDSPSELSSAFDLVVDITPPDQSRLSITSIYDDVGDHTGNIAHNGRTDDQNPLVLGTGTAGNTIIVYVQEASGKREAGRAVVGADGNWSLQVSDALAFGKNTFTAVEADASGNATAPSSPYSIIIGNDTVGGYDLAASSSSTLINTTTQGDQNNPQTTRLSNGNLVVVWQQNVAGNSSGNDVMMQIMDPTGKFKIGSEQLVNQRNMDSQDSPQVVGTADGGFVVVWESWQNSQLDNSKDGVFARAYNADGSAKSDEFVVNQTTLNSQRSPSVLSFPDGSYVIAWYSEQGGGSIVQRTFDDHNQPMGGEVVLKQGVNNYDMGGPEMVAFTDEAHAGWYLTVWTGAGTANDVFGQLRKADGSAAGSVFVVNTTRDKQQNFPDAITLKDGSFVVFWDTDDSGATMSDIRVIQYSFDPATGAQSVIGSGDFIVNDYRAGKQYKPVGVALDDGGYMLFWGSEGGDGSGSAIYGQRFDANSKKLGHEFLVNPITQGNQGSGFDNVDLTHILDATLMANGDVFVSWHSDNIDGNGYGIEGVVVDVDAGYYSEFTVNRSITGNQQQPMTAATEDGGFVVVWKSNQTGTATPMAQLFDANGMPVGAELRIGSAFANSAVNPHVSVLKDGSLLFSWHAWESGRDVIHTQRYGYTYGEGTAITGLTPIGAELTVGPAGIKYNQNAYISPLDDGGYLLTWQARSADNQPWQVITRHYDGDGRIVGGDTVVGVMGFVTATNPPPHEIIVTILDDGRAVIPYAKQVSGDSDIYFRVFDPANQSLSVEMRVNQTTAGIQGTPSISTLSNGNFIITWDSDNTSGPDQQGQSVWGRVYSQTGVAIGNEFLVNTYTPGNQKTPSIVSHPAGGFVALYVSEADIAPGGRTSGIYAQFFDDDGNRVGQEMRIHQLMAGDQAEPRATFLEDGRLFVTWTDYGVADGNGSAVKGRIIDLDSSVDMTNQFHHASNMAVTDAGVGESADHGSLWMLLDDGSASGMLLNGESLSAVHGGSGDDVIGIRDSSFSLIQGGGGIDTLLIDGKNLALDIDTLVNRITGIEKIDLGQGSANSISLSVGTLDQLAQTSSLQVDGKSQVVISGDASNSILLKDTMSENWTDAGSTQIDGVTYHSYVAGANELLIEQNIHVTVL